jgi:hypothetical protein
LFHAHDNSKFKDMCAKNTHVHFYLFTSLNPKTWYLVESNFLFLF